MLASVILLALASNAFADSGFKTGSIKVKGHDVTVYDDVTFGGQKLLGERGHSAQKIEDCVGYCLDYGKRGLKCGGVNFKKPMCWYLDSGITSDEETNVVKYAEKSGYQHAYIHPKVGETPPASPSTRASATSESKSKVKKLKLGACEGMLYEDTRYKMDGKFGKFVTITDPRSALSPTKCAEACRDYGRGKGSECKAANYETSKCYFLSGSGCPADEACERGVNSFTHIVLSC